MIDGLISALKRPAFIVCALTLGASAAGLEYAAHKFDLHFAKQPIEIRKPLGSLDRTKLGPYEFRTDVIIPPEMIDELGTEEYLQWTLTDTSQSSNSKTRYASLFITYYTGQRDPVPHVPDVCYLGGGYEQVGASEHAFDLPELAEAGMDATVPYRSVTFSKPGDFGKDTSTVCYLFSANSDLVANRTGVRLKLRKLTVRRAYFSKVEVGFFDRAGKRPPPEESRAAAERLFNAVLPVLVEEHWPTHEQVNRKSDDVEETDEDADTDAGTDA